MEHIQVTAPPESATQALFQRMHKKGWDEEGLKGLPGYNEIPCVEPKTISITNDKEQVIAQVIVQEKTSTAHAAIELSKFNVSTIEKEIKGRLKVVKRHEKEVVGHLFSFGTRNMQSEKNNESGYVCAYKPNANRDSTMERLVSSVSEGLHVAESTHFPLVAKHRSERAAKYDPLGKLRMSDNSKAWALANSLGYESIPHNETYYEVVLFCSDGVMGTWRFVISGIVIVLPTCGKLEAFLWTAPKVWHGTLPYKGDLPHLGVGTTISNNDSVMKRLEGQDGRTPTPLQNCSGFLFSAKFAKEAMRLQEAQRAADSLTASTNPPLEAPSPSHEPQLFLPPSPSTATNDKSKQVFGHSKRKREHANYRDAA